MPSVKALIRFLHAADGFPVKSTWLASIRAGNYATWTGLTYENTKTYHLTTAETLKGHMTQSRQGVRSAKCKATPSSPTRKVSPISSDIPVTKLNELFIVVEPVSKLYTDDMGMFPIHSRSGHRYIVFTLHCNSNAILIGPFQSRHDHHRIAAYSCIMLRLLERGHAVDLHVLDNEASKEYCLVITQTWKANFQLVPPDVHRPNAAERAIRTFKAHFLAILAGVDSALPSSIWDTLLSQTKLTLNLLCQATLAPDMSALQRSHQLRRHTAHPHWMQSRHSQQTLNTQVMVLPLP